MTKQEQKDLAWKEYDAIKGQAWKKYEAITDQAWEKYLAKCKKIDEQVENK